MATYTDVDTYYDLPDSLNYQMRVRIDDTETNTGNNVRVRMWVIRGSGTGRFSLPPNPPLGWSIAATGKTTKTGSVQYDFRNLSQGYALLIADETFVYTIAQGAVANITVRTKASMSTNNLGPFDESNSFLAFPLVTTPSYTISYDTNGGSAASSSQYLLNGTSGTFPDPGTRTNYTFALWDYAYSVGAQTPPLNGSDVTYTAYWTPLTWTVYYSANGGTVSPSSNTVTRGQSVNLPTPTRSGYTFNGWGVSSPYTPSSNITLTASWTPLTPGFTDETVTPQLFINQTIQSTANASVAASNTGTNPYSIQYGSGGIFPSWLSINAATGALSGSTDVPGVYAFTVNALGANGAPSVTSKVITITVVYPGRRINSTFGQSVFSTAKRYDVNNGWVALTKMKKFVGIGQPGADAQGWTNLSN